MKLLRNPEIKRALVLELILTAVFAAAGFFIEFNCGMLIIGACACMITVTLFTARRDLGRIAELSSTLDRILNGGEPLGLQDSGEGELAILKSEVYKLTLRLRERTHELEAEKVYLNDSIADISHQLRTPLTTINLIMSFLRKKNLTEEDRMKYMRDIDQQLARIEWLITSLLKISKIDAGTADFRHEKVDIADLISAAVEPLLIPIEIKNQEFEFIADGEEGFIGDIKWSTEAIGNIIKNCMEHTPDGGRVEVRVHENELFTEIVVQDTGSGIDPADLPHLFERFYKGKNSAATSVGIGLAMSKMIISEQNGSIKAENRKDGPGAKFTVKFYKKLV
jgi:Signal transduction histidine kinase